MTYANPVYPRNFPDPFVLRFQGRYYAFATGPAEDGRLFPILSSADLVHWREHGGALEPPRIDADAWWAPEVAYHEGRFYLYYAAGHDANPDHHLRVAVAEHPLGPWRDTGRNLTPHEIFAIDAHPFRDPRNGEWYLFYARDELVPPFAGTGIVVDRLLAMDRLEGRPVPVLRPHAGWHLFERKRAIKWGLDWYTVEGPFVVAAGSRFVCFYSGGRWERPNYGVGYALADDPRGPWTDDAGAAGPSVMRTIPERVIGPGHNSVVTGPDLVQQYLVYHGWDPGSTARMMRIDALVWRDGRPHTHAPSVEPQPAPRPPHLFCDFAESDPGSERERPVGAWERVPAGLRALGERAQLRLREELGDFVLEVSLRRGHAAPCGVLVGDLEVAIDPPYLRAGDRAAPLPPGFRPDVWRRLLLRRQGTHLTAVLDEYPRVETTCPDRTLAVGLRAGHGAEYAHVALTRL